MIISWSVVEDEWQPEALLVEQRLELGLQGSSIDTCDEGKEGAVPRLTIRRPLDMRHHIRERCHVEEPV